MNPHISSTINRQFIEAGCMNLAGGTPGVDYYHADACLYLRYLQELPNVSIRSVVKDTEVVIVVPDSYEFAAVIGQRHACEVVRLGDLNQFLTYRVYSDDCSDYRAAREVYYWADDIFGWAEVDLGQANKKFNAATAEHAIALEEFARANDAHKDAMATFWSHPKPPRFCAQASKSATTKPLH